MTHVTFDIYTKGNLVKTVTFNCGKSYSNCPPPKTEEEDPFHFIHVTRATFPFGTVPEDADMDDEYEMHIRGLATPEGDTPIWELVSHFNITDATY